MTKTLLASTVEQPQVISRRHWPVLLGLALVSEGLYVLLLLALRPIAGLGLVPTPLQALQSWTNLALPPSRVGAISLLLTLLLALTACYALAGWRSLTGDHPGGSGSMLGLVLGPSLLFGLTLLCLPTLFSDTAFASLFSGRLIALYGLAPWRTTPPALVSDPYWSWLTPLTRHSPLVYGPLWEWLCALLALLPGASSPALGLLLLKGLLLLAHLLNTLLIWSLLGRLGASPHARFTGSLLYAWNPLALLALAGDGHSEGLLLTLLLLALWGLLAGEQGERSRAVALLAEGGALVALGLAVALSPLALPLWPLLAGFSLWQRAAAGSRWSRLWAWTWRLLLPAVVVLLLALPLWRGADSYRAIMAASGWYSFARSPLALLVPPLRWLYTPLAVLLDSPRHRQPAQPAELTVKGGALFCFTLLFIWLLASMSARFRSRRDCPPLISQSLSSLITSCLLALGAWLLLLSFNFWPWYALPVLGLATLRRGDALSGGALLFSLTALLSFALLGIGSALGQALEGLLIFLPPLVYLTGAFFWRGRRAIFKEAQSST
ncbi:MAG: hypothetical protein IRZ31_01310 [Thermogemmatispora sp.]|uniref:hypothetical protein n=1 Tax=Thermogemmatispora sp. TaxID=1968838 RepID=UPI002630C17D|nr:hypothetical protein [Thermogemmatispora sp.]MBX5455510.1 hypothetical protein [Thermogemmatispora sp.]